MNNQPRQDTSPDYFQWLHLSDIHVGMSDQDWLWPTLKHALFSDMSVLHSQAGPWELVIFSGDLTQRGSPTEFEQLDLILTELWTKFKTWGFSPQLIVLPGNHDIARVTPLSPELRLLRKWWDEPEIHREFFSDSNAYRDAIGLLLKSYNEWA